MSGSVRLVRISGAVIDPREVEEAVWTSADGAVVTFSGVVRDHDGGKSVAALEYSAHPQAERLMAELCAEVAGGSEDTDDSPSNSVRVAAAHRVGELAVGDVAVAVAVASPHRAEAFELCRVLIDRLKHEIPIWKRQHFADGLSEWVGAGECC